MVFLGRCPRLGDECCAFGAKHILDHRYRLLYHFLKLLPDYRSVKAIDGDAKPIAFFPFHKETIRIKLLIGLIVGHGRL